MIRVGAYLVLPSKWIKETCSLATVQMNKISFLIICVFVNMYHHDDYIYNNSNNS